MSDLSFRTREVPITVEGNRLVGLIAPFNSPTTVREIGAVFQESIRPGAFAKSLKENKSIWALIKHNKQERIARYPTTLSLRETPEGLYGELELPDSDYGKTIRWHVEHGNYTGWSFGFDEARTKDKWTRGPMAQRELLEIDMHEVTLTDIPVYSTTTVAVREQAQVYTANNFDYYLAKIRIAQAK